MIVVYPFSVVDQDLALKNARWMNDLGGCKGHEVLMIYDRRCNPETVKAIGLELTRAFNKVYPYEETSDINGWPEGANCFFRITACRLETKPNTQYFMWMEPDAIPLRKGWLDMLEAEYKRGGKPFMGDRVQVGDIPLHMSGIGIYPLPLHAYAGEAYRAADIAWDMAGKDQIVPKAHFTRLIEHAWKHPKFTMLSELETQIRPEAILFHSSKDGSLIDLLKGKKGKEPMMASIAQTQKEPDKPGSPSSFPSCGIFIRTYPGDYEWLNYCLRSIAKYCRGFQKMWIVSPEEAPPGGPRDLPAAVYACDWKVIPPELEDGYLDQQVTKLYADVITRCEVDFYLHIDSDVILNRPVTPESFLTIDAPNDGDLERQVVWPYTPYKNVDTPWQPVIEKFMGHPVENEFMRRLPIMVPRWLYAKMREYCFRQHGVPLCDYIRMQPPRAFSEFNALGAYAYTHHHDKCVWLNTLDTVIPGPFAKQFHSWGGITPEIKAEMENILSGGNPERAATVGDGNQSLQAGEVEVVPTTKENVPAAQIIKKLPNGVWVLHGDQISQWVEAEGRLDHDQNFLPKILPHIEMGAMVVDVGAFIGDHTIAYAKAVGDLGRVHTFEPNPMAYECLKHNVVQGQHHNVVIHDTALGDKHGSVPLSGNNGNWGGAYVGEHMKITDVPVQPLDDYRLAPDFIKIDVEGYEMKVLRGAEKTIDQYRPKLVIEMNQVALERQGADYASIYQWLREHNYEWLILQENCWMNSPMYDILCLPFKDSPEVMRGGEGLTRCVSSPPPVTLDSSILFLQNLAAVSNQSRWEVMFALYKAGLTPRKDNKPRKKKHEIPVPSDPPQAETPPQTTPAKKGKRPG
jgi:FkbM family methyltransferase